MILTRLIREIQSGGTLEAGRLAARLGTTPELVAAMLEHLERAGLLEACAEGGSACGGCSLGAACRAPAGVRLWRAAQGGPGKGD